MHWENKKHTDGCGEFAVRVHVPGDLAHCGVTVHGGRQRAVLLLLLLHVECLDVRVRLQARCDGAVPRVFYLSFRRLKHSVREFKIRQQ